MLSVRPMDSFRTAGRNTGPGAVIGQAIRGILEQGRKRGLIQEQAGSNLISSMGAAGYKQGLEQQYDEQDVIHQVVNPNTGEVQKVPGKRGLPPKVGGGQPNIYNFLDPNSTGVVPTQQISDEEAYKIYLQSQGQ